MPTCKQCGKRGLFLKLRDSLCKECLVLRSAETVPTVKLSESEHIPVSFCDTPEYHYAHRLAIAIDEELKSNDLGKNILHEIRTFGVDRDFSEALNETYSLLAYRSLTSGERPKFLAKEAMENIPGIDYDLAYSAMRTKCAIAHSAMSKYRALPRMPWYIWRTCRDERVRPEHAFMDGVVCNWNDPPNPCRLLNNGAGECVHPGYADTCRCIALSVISPEDIELPVKVHLGGKIITIKTIDALKKLLV